jgi:serine/threonine protein kinase
MFLVMEPMDSSLFQVMTALSEGELMPVPRVKMVMRQVMRGLEHMHARGVIHRDIKPENVLLKEDVVKLADFGLACITCDPMECTRKCGTLEYMAPEMQCDGMYTPAVDVWAAGCILLELALGHISGKPLPPGMPQGMSMPIFFSTLTPDHLALLKCSTPTEYSDIMDLLSLLLRTDPKSRISATDALMHPCLVVEDDMVVTQHTTGISLPHIKLLQMQFSACSQHAQALEEHLTCIGLTVPLQ